MGYKAAIEFTKILENTRFSSQLWDIKGTENEDARYIECVLAPNYGI